MKRYIGTKLLTAVAMTRGEYNEYRGWAPPDKEDQTVPGYLVEYIDGGGANDVRHTGYISWSPKDVFEAAYRPCHEMTFGLAIEALKRGDTVARTGWNGAGMFVYLVPANAYPAQTGAAKAYFGEGALVPYGAYFALVGVDGIVRTWVPSITDALAEDWAIVNTALAAEAPIDATFTIARPAHQQRVVTERDELAEKISKLAAFLVTPTYQRLADEEQTRLANQLDVMRLYCAVLNQRIDAFPVG
ncbi:MAG: DUF2829 domain-containing protein [Pseudomonadota bacterium]